MAAEVAKRVQGKPEERRLEIMLGDVVKLPELPYFDVCISNTPYQVGISQGTLSVRDTLLVLIILLISSPLTFKLLSLSPSPRTCILTFQLEFAQRLFARPGSALYSRLSVNTQMWATVTHIMKIGRNNFRPPPAVESSVIRLQPKKPRPAISWDEWDGLLRVCFVRKNRTLRAGFLGTTTVLEMLEQNYRTWCAQNDVSVEDGPPEIDGEAGMEVDTQIPTIEEDGPIDEDEEWNGIMDIDDVDTPSFFHDELDERAKQLNEKSGNKRKRKGKVAELVREKVRKVLEDETELADKRARMCDESDFLKLLWAFNKEGIHFS